jgi:hypothetical protein
MKEDFLIEGMREKNPSGENVRSQDWGVINIQVQRSVPTDYPSPLTSSPDGSPLLPGRDDGWYTFGFAYIPIVSDTVSQLTFRFLQINCDGEPFPLTSGRGSVCLIRVETTILPPLFGSTSPSAPVRHEGKMAL